MDTTADAYLYTGVRMMTLDDVIKLVGTVIPAASIAITAYYASRGLKAWREQLVGRRRFELAEEILTVTFTVEQRIRFIRNGSTFTGEGQTRPRGESEPDPLTGSRDMYFVPLERIAKHDETLRRFDALRVMAQAHWGAEAALPFDTVLRVVREVAVASRMLIATVGESAPGSCEHRDRWQAMIWDGWEDGEEDVVTKRVTAAVREIEALCRQHLR